MSLDDAFSRNCSKCNASLERGYSQRGDEFVCRTCANDENLAKWAETRELTTRLVMMAEMHMHDVDNGREVPTDESGKTEPYREVRESAKRIYEAIGEFGEKYWAPYLRHYYQSSSERGHEASNGDFKVLMWGCAGRIMVTIQDARAQSDPDNNFGGAWISVLGHDDSAGVGLQGVCATEEEAVALLKAATLANLTMKSDADVSMLGV